MNNFTNLYVNKEFERYSALLYNLFNHIEGCHNNGIITVNEKNKYFNYIECFIKKINSIYEKSKDSAFNNKMIDVFYILEKANITSYDNIDINIFNSVKLDIICNFKHIGMASIFDICNILVGNYFLKYIDKEEDFYKKIMTFNKIFTPITFNKVKSNINSYSINIKNSECEYYSLINNYFTITIEFPYKKITIEGFIKYDPMNIILKTSKINDVFLYDKYEKIKTLLMSSKKINENFKMSYINNLSIKNIITEQKKDILKKMKDSYDYYIKLSNMTFKNLLHEFLNSKENEIQHYFNIIDIFLTNGSDDDINIAGLLLSLMKDKKKGSEVISSIIIKNLSFNNQLKIKKQNISIKNELSKFKNINQNDIDLTTQVLVCKDMPNYIKNIIIDKLEEMKSNNGDYYKQKTYIDCLLNYPWKVEENYFKSLQNDNDESIKLLDNVKYTLDTKIFGHDDCKSLIQELIGRWIANPSSSSKSIAIHGPPGTGKTLFAKSLGASLNLPFSQISLSGLDDRCILNGHSYTYNSAQPGLILRKIVEAGKSRCIIYFDELDKTCTKNGINEISNVLIHVTDPNTNDKYVDSFFSEINFDLSKILFIFSYNDKSKIDKVLLDRMEKIEIKSYTTKDKIKITKNFLLKEICDELNFSYDLINISEKNIEYIIENYTMESGVRELKRKLEKIYSKLNLEKIYKKGFFSDTMNKEGKITLEEEHIDNYLNKKSIDIKKIHDINSIGFINGLYVCDNGTGGVIPISVYKSFNNNKDKINLILTGNQGTIMQESVYFAYTIAMNLVKEKYRNKFINNSNFDLHIHTVDASTSKEGPSAGCAFTIAFLSVILNIKIKHNIAITGEIDNIGKVSKIGGLIPKIRGGYREGVKIFFIPKENEKELEIFYKDNSDMIDIEIYPINNIYEALEITFSNDEKFIASDYLI
jgi:endopeptidase La